MSLALKSKTKINLVLVLGNEGRRNSKAEGTGRELRAMQGAALLLAGTAEDEALGLCSSLHFNTLSF